MNRALRALRGLLRGTQQADGGRLHGVGAVAHALEFALDALAEVGDGALDDGAAALQLLHRGGRDRGDVLLGDVGVGRDPAAVAHRPVGDRDEAAFVLPHVADRLALGDVGEQVRDVLVAVSGEGSDLGAMVDQIA